MGTAHRRLYSRPAVDCACADRHRACADIELLRRLVSFPHFCRNSGDAVCISFPPQGETSLCSDLAGRVLAFPACGPFPRSTIYANCSSSCILNFNFTADQGPLTDLERGFVRSSQRANADQKYPASHPRPALAEMKKESPPLGHPLRLWFHVSLQVPARAISDSFSCSASGAQSLRASPIGTLSASLSVRMMSPSTCVSMRGF